MRRLLTLSIFGCLLIFLTFTGINQGYLKTPPLPPTLNRFLLRLGLDLTPTFPAAVGLTQTTPEDLFAKINRYRQSQDLPALSNDAAVCSVLTAGQTQAVTDAVLAVCPTCTRATLITAARFVSPNELLTPLIYEDGTNDSLLNPAAAYLCIADRSDQLALLFIEQGEPVPGPAAPARTVQKLQPRPLPTPVPKNFSEAELWSALVDYRHAHQRPDIIKEESLCVYARKRVQDHLTGMATKSPSDYPNPDKYPLDSHTGFTEDADTGYAFDVTGKSHLAENLAYMPTAQYPHQIIEWGWDTSTEGHREAQLSTEWSHGCISGGGGFYVAIFGR